MFKYLADLAKIEYYNHIKLRVRLDNPKNLETAINALRVLEISGANITLPYKLDVIKYLDQLDPMAASIGAVNTVVNNNATLTGYNTDSSGSFHAIERYLKNVNQNDKVIIFGTGGAARAITYLLATKTKDIVFLDRTISGEKAEEFKKYILALGISPTFLELNDLNIERFVGASDIIINATSVGMAPDNGRSLISKQQFNNIAKISSIKDKYFFDAVLNPPLTEMLTTAQEYGASVCSGIHTSYN